MIVPSATKFFGYKSSSLNDFALDTRVLTLSYKYKHWILNKFDWADFRTAPKLKYLKPAVPFSFFPPLLPSPLPPNRSKVSSQSLRDDLLVRALSQNHISRSFWSKMSDGEGGKKSGYRLEYASSARAKCKGTRLFLTTFSAILIIAAFVWSKAPNRAPVR